MSRDDARPEPAEVTRAEPTLLRLVWADSERPLEHQGPELVPERLRLSTRFWSVGPDEGPAAA
jgi:hypothetical protein